MKIKEFKKIHCIGIGGAGLGGFALIAQHLGAKISGSDRLDTGNCASLLSHGATISFGEHDAANLPKDATCVVYSSAVPEENPERVAAKKKGLPQFDYHTALGMLTRDKDNIVVAGTHGKSTTTAILGLILSNTKFKPTTLVGSKVPGFDGGVMLGSDKTYVLEGDEYKRGVLELDPYIVLLNNIEWDHPDIFPSESSYIEMFNDFVLKLTGDGTFVYNADDHASIQHVVKPSCHSVSFGITNTNVDLYAKNIKIAHGRQIFRLVYKGQELKDFNIKIPGRHNIYNALGAALVALELGISQDVIKDVLSTFTGIWRRYEAIGTLKGAQVISDYAHHPTALKNVVQATKDFYPDKEIIMYFQPHQKARTRSLLKDFAKVIEALPVTHLLLHEIYDVPGRSDEIAISSKDIVKGLKKKVTFVDNFDDGFKQISKLASKDSVVLIVGAGDIDSNIRQRLA